MNENSVVNVVTRMSHPFIVFGDTTGFTRYAQRTYEDPKIVRDYLLETINLYFEYQKKTNCALKLECDGFIAFHESPAKKRVNTARMILTETEYLHHKVDALIQGLQYPRPDGFRIRVATGPAWNVAIHLKRPFKCADNSCLLEVTHDSFGYPGYLASRMQETKKSVPLLCCQAIYEMFHSDNHNFEFKKMRPDNHVPDGIFKEDWANLWSYKTKEKKSVGVQTI